MRRLLPALGSPARRMSPAGKTLPTIMRIGGRLDATRSAAVCTLSGWGEGLLTRVPSGNRLSSRQAKPQLTCAGSRQMRQQPPVTTITTVTRQFVRRGSSARWRLDTGPPRFWLERRRRDDRSVARDGWQSTNAGRHLSGRRKAHTRPEVDLRRALHASGVRFRLQRKLAKGCTPDLVLPRYKLAVFVDGCFWHGCPTHGRKVAWNGPNAHLWELKMARNLERDQRANAIARQLGWTVVRLWEHEIAADPAQAAARVLAASTAWPSERGSVDPSQPDE